MLKPIIFACSVALCSLSAMPAEAAPCSSAAFKKNENEKGKFNVWVRNHSSKSDWIYVKLDREREMKEKYSKALEITFDNRQNPTFSLELRRTGLSTSKAVFCEYRFKVGSKGREFTLKNGACADEDDKPSDIAKIDCTRSYNSRANRMTLKLTVNDKILR